MSAASISTIAADTGSTSANAAMPTAGIRTRRISSVAYATDDMLSEEKIARAVARPNRSCSSLDVARGRPRIRR
jgi:hypothetical protein